MADDPSEEYANLIKEAEVGIEQATEKLDGGRLKDLEREQTRVDYLHVLDKLLQTKLDALRARDEQQDEIATRVIAREAVEERFDQFEHQLMQELSGGRGTED